MVFVAENIVVEPVFLSIIILSLAPQVAQLSFLSMANFILAFVFALLIYNVKRWFPLQTEYTARFIVWQISLCLVQLHTAELITVK